MSTLATKILATKKYQGLNVSLVEGICQEAEQKYPAKLQEKKVKASLHQIYEMFLAGKPNYPKILANLKANLGSRLFLKELDLVASLHVSSQERLAFFKDFYNQIFAITGKPKSILDLGCGFNPLVISRLGLEADFVYSGLDINSQQIDFLSQVVDLMGLEKNIFLQTQTCQEFLQNLPETKFEVVFLLKMLQTLELQEKNLGKKLFKAIKTDYFVVSFPTKSIGRQKSLASFYKTWFANYIADLDLKIVSELEFASELVFILK
jgi:16S rRNA (guanine(1405)-N(7))-methyltransferase